MFEGDTEEKLKMEIQELKEIQEGYKKECERSEEVERDLCMRLRGIIGEYKNFEYVENACKYAINLRRASLCALRGE